MTSRSVFNIVSVWAVFTTLNIKKKKKNLFVLKYWSGSGCGLNPDSTKYLDPDPDSVNPDSKHCVWLNFFVIYLLKFSFMDGSSLNYVFSNFRTGIRTGTVWLKVIFIYLISILFTLHTGIPPKLGYLCTIFWFVHNWFTDYSLFKHSVIMKAWVCLYLWQT